MNPRTIAAIVAGKAAGRCFAAAWARRRDGDRGAGGAADRSGARAAADVAGGRRDDRRHGHERQDDDVADAEPDRGGGGAAAAAQSQRLEPDARRRGDARRGGDASRARSRTRRSGWRSSRSMRRRCRRSRARCAPRVIVFTNLFRDQLDRYGEVDTVARVVGARARRERWRTAAAPTLVLNADDPAVAHLGAAYGGRVAVLRRRRHDGGRRGDEHASDFRTCLDCGAELAYTATFYGHIGHWRCPSCGNARPAPDVRRDARRRWATTRRR